MVPTDILDNTLDPVEEINATLEHTWLKLCEAYDVSACLPDIQTLFANANLARPQQAAETVVAGMLLEVIESIGRFSPYYKMPARAFGVTSMRDKRTNRIKWLLAPEAIQKWDALLKPLTQVVHQYGGLIRAMLLVDDLMQDMPGDPCVSAQCHCVPPRIIQIRQSVLLKSEILCETCMQPYD